MKHKVSKRFIQNKHSHHRIYQTQTRRLSTPIDHARTISPNRTDASIATELSDSFAPCLKPNVPLRPLKQLKRDLLRCSNQRPSLLGPQTLQPLRLHHGLQQAHSVATPSSSSSSSTDRSHGRRRRSLSVSSHTFTATTDLICPWPDMSINRLRSDRKDPLRPLKTHRNTKNSHLLSPKYCSSLSDKTNQFQFHPSRQTYIDEYRKQKGYKLDLKSKAKRASSSSSSSLSRKSQDFDDDQVSAAGTFCGGTGENGVQERTDLSSSLTQTMTKSTDEAHENMNRPPVPPPVVNQVNILPSIPTRSNNYFRSTRRMQQPQPVTLPLLTNSFRYLNSVDSGNKIYNDTNKKTSVSNQSKLYFIDGRQKKRYSIIVNLSIFYYEQHE